MIEYYVMNNNACSIKTKEDLYIVFYHKYGVITPREAGNKIGRESMKQFLSLLDDPDMYQLAERDALWFQNIVNKYFVCVVEGTSVYCEVKDGLANFLAKNYNIIVNEPKDTNQIEINFIYNRLNSMYVDPGKLAMIIINYQQDKLHKVIL